MYGSITNHPVQGKKFAQSAGCWANFPSKQQKFAKLSAIWYGSNAKLHNVVQRCRVLVVYTEV